MVFFHGYLTFFICFIMRKTLPDMWTKVSEHILKLITSSFFLDIVARGFVLSRDHLPFTYHSEPLGRKELRKVLKNEIDIYINDNYDWPRNRWDVLDYEIFLLGIRIYIYIYISDINNIFYVFVYCVKRQPRTYNSLLQSN